ncbi:MAG: hypothetical protein SGARI_007435 [Bacillariaceae sp.]
MGGAYDVMGVSSGFDEVQDATEDVFGDIFDGEDNVDKDGNEAEPVQSKAREEAELLISYLRQINVGEMAGYVSCLVGETGRNSLDAIDVFRRVDPTLQRCIQVLLDSRDRFMDVQRQFSVDERTANCQFDLSNFEVVSSWANGCSWTEALEISGAAPGDLTRILGRAMDGLRQIGALKYNPLRKKDFSKEDSELVDPFTRGIHPEIRRLCREAAREMNRYPVKDPLPFEVTEEDVIDDPVDAVEEASEDEVEAGETIAEDSLPTTTAEDATE